jgi:hypothetical protein
VSAIVEAGSENEAKTVAKRGFLAAVPYTEIRAKKPPRVPYDVEIDGRPAKAIPLTRGITALFDPGDLDRIQGLTWYATRCGYAACATPDKKRTLLMHRVLLGDREGLEIDHINGIRSDNRRVNLRWVTHQENCLNRHDPPRGKSGLRYVYLKNGRWVAQVRIGGRSVYLGMFLSANEAHEAAIAAKREAGHGTL